MTELLEKSEQIVSKNHNEDYEYYGLLVLTCYALLCKFEPYEEIIKELFDTCEFHIENKPLFQIIYKENFSIETINSHLDLGSLVGLANSGEDLHYDAELDCYIKTPPSIYCSAECDATELLDTTIHELAHLVKGRINNSFIDEDNNSYKRSGIQLMCEETETYMNLALDEAINTLQTADMSKYIKDLINTPMNKKVKEFYNKLNQDNLGQISGNELVANLLLPLWNNEHFKSNIESNIVEGNIDLIENDFNSIIRNENAFNDFSEAFDIVDQQPDVNDSLINRYQYIQAISKLYDTSCELLKRYNKV